MLLPAVFDFSVLRRTAKWRCLCILNEQNILPKRKLPRLTKYDYSQNGYYFTTICTDHHHEILSHILPGESAFSVHNQLTGYGKAVEEELLNLPQRFLGLSINQYVIMPNHIHVIFIFEHNAPYSLSDVICAFKSLATRKCKQIHPINVVFQKSFHDHIIRGQSDYEMIWNYIDANPINWEKDCFHPEENK